MNIKNELSEITGISNISISSPMDVIDGYLITKEKRREMFGIVSGGAGSIKPEKYQISKILEGTKIDCIKKNNIRINFRKNIIEIKHNPNKNDSGYDFSEDFDCIQELDDKIIFINLKCIVGCGGIQTRSLREVYWFIEGQLRILKTHNKYNLKNIYFANILDGDEAFKNFDKFNYLISLYDYENIKEKIYIGDLKQYFNWFNRIFQ